MHRVVAVVRAALALASVCVVLVGLHSVGDGALAAPPVDVEEFGSWLRSRDPLVASAALFRVIALGASWYLAGACVLGLVAQLTRLRVLSAAVRAVTTPAVRRLTHGVVGVSLLTATTTPMTPAFAADQPTQRGSVTSSTEPDGDVPTLPALEAGRSVLGRPSAADGSATGRSALGADGFDRLPRMASRPFRPLSGASTPPAAPQLPDEGGASPSPGPPTDDREHVVEPGESFWTIAADVVSRRGSGSATTGEISSYWLRLVDTNRRRLVDVDDPDLVLPGQRLILPEHTTGGVVEDAQS